MCLGVCVSAVLEYFQWTRRVPQPGQARVPHIYDANGQRLRSSGLGGLALGFATILNHHLPNQHWSPLESTGVTEDPTELGHAFFLGSPPLVPDIKKVDGREKWGKIG